MNSTSTSPSGPATHLPPDGSNHPVPAGRGRQGRSRLAAEAFGYTGGVLATVGLLTSVHELWPHPSVSVQLAMAATASAVLGAAGALVRPGHPPLARLRGGLWTMSVIAAAAFTGLFMNEVLHVSSDGVLTLPGAVATCCALALLRWAPSPALGVTAFTAAGLAATAGTAWAAPAAASWAPGLSLWLLSALWAGATERGYLKPRRAGLFAVATGLLISTVMVADSAGGPALALATAVAVLAAGVLARRGWLVVTGAIVMVVAVSEALLRYLPHSAAVPIALLAVGAVLVGTALWFSRRRSGLRCRPAHSSPMCKART
jgi:hypothetical protein